MRKDLNAYLEKLKSRSGDVQGDVAKTVEKIIKDVKRRGDEALLEYERKFGDENISKLTVSAKEIKSAYDLSKDDLKTALNKAAENIRAYHLSQVEKDYEIKKDDGVILGNKVRGLDRVGIYVPGGTAAYPSSVLMNAIPAKLAGVNEIIMMTPSGVKTEVLAAAYVGGVDKIYLAGGAQAIAAMAYGTESIKSVDKIVGPGNIYVAEAKRAVYGIVDIDMIAGPSEILIIADKSGNSKFIAADMLSQAEHDTHAAAIFLTNDASLADKVEHELKIQSAFLPRKEVIKESLTNYGFIGIFEDMERIIEISEKIAPEHLEIMTDNPMKILSKIRNAGSVFLGDYTPETLGDYFSGTNHVLPTMGTAKYASPLGVYSFVKKMSYTYYTKDALKKDAKYVELLAKTEGLKAHEKAVSKRFLSETIKLDANESFLNPGDVFKEKLKDAIDELSLNRYPDDNYAELRKAYGKYKGMDYKSIVAGNGSDELISILISSFLKEGEKFMFLEPDFSMYKIFADNYSKKYISTGRNNDGTFSIDDVAAKAIGGKVKLLIFSNPSSMHGTVMRKNHVLNLADKLAEKNIVLVVDEAYMEFSNESVALESVSRENIFVLSTFSKALSFAGIRLGFAIGNHKLIEALNSLRPPYNVSVLNEKAGIIGLSEPDYIKNAVVKIKENKEELILQLEELKRQDFKIIPSETNFIFIETNKAEQIYEALKKEAVLIRKFGERLRISIGEKWENEILAEQLREILS